MPCQQHPRSLSSVSRSSGSIIDSKDTAAVLMKRKRYFSTDSNSRRFMTAPAAASDVLAMGCHGRSGNFVSSAAERYNTVVRTALENGISTYETGAGPAGETAFAAAYRAAVAANPDLLSAPIQVLFRVGYRTVPQQQQEQEQSAAADDGGGTEKDDSSSVTPPPMSFPGDVTVEQISASGVGGGGAGGGAAAAMDADLADADTAADGNDDDDASAVTMQKHHHVVHNIGPEYLHHAVTTSALSELQKEYPDAIELVACFHNPEVQQQQQVQVEDGGTASNNDNDNDDDRMSLQQRLAESFTAAELLAAGGVVNWYGITSNGLCLPSDHPLHLSWRDTVAAAAQQAAAETGRPLRHFRVIQLPANALETAGVRVASTIAADLSPSSSSDDDDLGKALPAMDEIHAIRPLTCYPDAGTGTGHAFVLADYELPATMEKSLRWSNEMEHVPDLYAVALKTAMRHFDADELLQLKASGADLSAEQRETLDGCKLMQSLLFDVDHGLEGVRSLTAHEEELYTRIIPLIRDTFEGYDEETAAVLQSFFGAYGMAAQYAVARNTRALLTAGESGGSSTSSLGGASTPVYPDLPATKRLQEFALEFLLQQQQRQQEQQQEREQDNDDDNKNNKEDDEGSSTATAAAEEKDTRQQEQQQSPLSPPLLFSKLVIGWTEPGQVVDSLQIVDRACSFSPTD